MKRNNHASLKLRARILALARHRKSLIKGDVTVIGDVTEMVHEIDLTGNVPSYGQEQCCWCGAASAQMIMNGYPNAVDRIWITQGLPAVGPPVNPNCWDTIQANNSTDPADVPAGWCTDPEGLRDCLRSLNPPPSGTWNIHMNANRDTVMFNIMYWMNQNQYPVAVLINEGGHWVVIAGFESDIEPTAGSTPALQEITYHDPEPHNVGSTITKTGAQWYADEWDGAIRFAGTWLNTYVAVIEPPKKGTVKVEMVERMGEEILETKLVEEFVYRLIEELELAKKPQCLILGRKGIRHLQPILVYEEVKGLVPSYYLVPFGLEKETGPCDEPVARLGIIINAYTGQFEEIGAFGKPVSYLPEMAAIKIAAKALALPDDQIDKMVSEREISATMMFQHSELTHIRIYPFWKITIKDKTLYVDQLGKLYNTIVPSRPGD